MLSNQCYRGRLKDIREYFNSLDMINLVHSEDYKVKYDDCSITIRDKDGIILSLSSDSTAIRVNEETRYILLNRRDYIKLIFYIEYKLNKMNYYKSKNINKNVLEN